MKSFFFLGLSTFSSNGEREVFSSGWDRLRQGKDEGNYGRVMLESVLEMAG